MNPGLFGANGTAREYPVDNAPSIKQRLWRCRPDMLTRELVSKLCAAQVGRGIRAVNIQIKIACQNDRKGRLVLAGIVKAIKQLGATQTVIPPAFQVKVVTD